MSELKREQHKLFMANLVLDEIDLRVHQALETWLKTEHDDAKLWDAYAWELGVYKLQLNTVAEHKKIVEEMSQ